MSDNLTTPIPPGTSMATKQLSDGSHASKGFAVDAAGADVMGAVEASPAVYSIGGRLKAIADAIIARLPATLGSKTATNSLSIVPASDAGMATSAKQDALLAATAVGGAPFPITPHATNPLERPITGLAIKTAGTIVFRFAGESSDRTVDLAAGFYPVGNNVTHIRASSGATGLTGF